MNKRNVKNAYEEYFYFPLYRFVRRLKDIPDDIIAFYQRGKRGYADSDAWGIDWYLNSFMPELLMTMIDPKKGGGNSYPSWGKGARTYKEWHETVKKIAKGFEAGRKLQNDFFDISKGKGLALKKQQDEGLKLFVKWYDALWD
jgi:hypothetical protein